MRRTARRAGAIVAIATVVSVLVGGLATVAAIVSVERRLDRVYDVSADLNAAPVEVSESPSAIERGAHLVEGVAQCTTCHGDDLSGRAMADDLLIGRLFAPNLTPGAGGIRDYSTQDLVRSIRHGVGRDGRPLIVMPAQYLFQLSDTDLGAVISYLRTLPPVDRTGPDRRLGPLSVAALLAGKVPELIPAELMQEQPPRIHAPTPAVTADYGLYLIEVSGCKICHRDDLSGGLHPLSLPGEPPPADLRMGGPLSDWTELDFVAALRTGQTPDDRQLDDEWMPWKTFARMSDLELRAIWRGLTAIDSRPSAASISLATRREF